MNNNDATRSGCGSALKLSCYVSLKRAESRVLELLTASEREKKGRALVRDRKSPIPVPVPERIWGCSIRV